MVASGDMTTPVNMDELYHDYPRLAKQSDLYLIDEVFSEGASAQVAICLKRKSQTEDGDLQRFAAKIFSHEVDTPFGYSAPEIDEVDVARCIREVEMLKLCTKDCVFIVDFVDALNVYPSYFKIILELARPVNVMFSDTRMEEADLKAILYCLVSALAHIHALGIAHGDVKPRNLLYSDKGYVKLCDFGAAWRVGIDDREELFELGTVSYAAPEILPKFIDQDLEVPFGMKQDIWAAGIVAFRGFYGKDLPKMYKISMGDDEQAAFREWLDFLKSHGIQFVNEDAVDPAVVEFVQECTRVDNPKRRPTAEDLLSMQFLAELSEGDCRERLLTLSPKLYKVQFEVMTKEYEERERREKEEIKRQDILMRAEAVKRGIARRKAIRAYERKELFWSNPLLYFWKRANGTV